MKFIHTSDWHIGRQFHNVSLIEDQRQVLNQIVAYAEDEAVDAVVIAGDIYDRSVPPATAVELLDDVLHRLCGELSIPVLMIPGNHDSAERLGFGARQLRHAGLYIFSDLQHVHEPVVITDHKGLSVLFYGIPFNDPEQVRDQFEAEISGYDEAHRFLLDRIKQNRDNDQINILISHCFVEGGDESESERPLSVGGADRVSWEPMRDFDYVALGHLHRPQSKQGDHIRYSGSILKYGFSEQHDKSITLVEIERKGRASTRYLPLQPEHDLRVLEGTMEEIIEAGKVDPNAEDYLLIRLTDQHAILDAMGKLREVYPNVLHLEKPGLMAPRQQRKAVNRDKVTRSELAMFADFYEQATGNTLSPEQDEALKSLLERLHRQREEY